MRVTQNTNYNTVRDSIHTTKARMENLQNQASSLKKLNKPSDNPVGAAKVLEIRTEKMNNQQFQMTARMAETFLNNSDHALAEMADIVVRAKEIALGQASGASANEGTRLGISEEVAQLYKQSISLANSRIGERYLFGGYRTNQPPVTGEGHYMGDDGQMMVEIADDVFVTMNLNGLELFNTHPEASSDLRRLDERRQETEEKYGEEINNRAPATIERLPEEMEGQEPENVNVFQELQNLRISLLTGDMNGIRNTLERFDQTHAHLISMRAKLGSRLQGIQSTGNALERHAITSANLSQSLEDADMANVVSELAKEETVFRSALGSAQKLIQPTLMDFLK